MSDKTKILIVDDIELNRAILSELFKDTYDVLEAEDGAAAIAILTQHLDSVAIVLLDIVMPVMDGFAVLQEMSRREWMGRIPVVMITSETSEDAMRKGYDFGVADMISKPFVPNIIRQRINNIVEQYTYKNKLEQLVQQQTSALRQQDQKLRENSAKMIDILSAVIEFKNSESVNHIQNIRTLTRLLLEQLSYTHHEYGLTDELIAVISEAAAMHDIGKVAIPDHILNKPSSLTDAEFEIMKTHTVRGCEMLEKLSAVQHLDYYDYYYEICRHHHERWDGNGYPDGLMGEAIPIWAQVVSLADVYDALTSQRVYKDAYSDETAVRMILDGECGVFNPVLISCFLTLTPTLIRKTLSTLPQGPITHGGRPAQVVPHIHHETDKELSSRTLHLLELERQKYHIMSELSGEILFDYDVKTDRLAFSEQFHLLLKLDPIITHVTEQLQSDTLVHSDDRTRFERALQQMTAEHPSCKLDLRVNLGGLGFSWYGVYLYALWDMDYETHCLGYMGKLIDIEQQKQEHLKLQEAADNDPLTGILNRKALYCQIIDQLSTEQVLSGALCFIDIDNFKQLNDTYGHLYGDSALKRVSEVLSAHIRNSDLVGRIGGDEFLVFLRNFSDVNALTAKVAAICESLHFDDCGLSGSIGVSCFPQHGVDFRTLLQRSDQALYQAKHLGKSRYYLYQEGQEEFPLASATARAQEELLAAAPAGGQAGGNYGTE